MNTVLKARDPKLWNILCKEYKRQRRSLELIASENFTSRSVMECLGSVFTNKYSEGQAGARYYGGCEHIDEVENLCRERALSAFNLNPKVWSVNVQPYSGSPANMAVYMGLLKPHDRIMGLDLPSGGHLTHGFYTQKKKISATSIVFESFPYKVNSEGLIDYDSLERIARDYKPQMIICGASAYPRDFDYKRFREIADINGSYLLCDMAHISGLVAKSEMNSPFEYCDVVTSTTHKTLRGPRSGIIFSKCELSDAIDFSVFPGLQGGPHNHQIAALATQLREVCTDEFRDYIRTVKSNAKVLAEHLTSNGFNLVTGGTENHIVLVDLRNQGLTGSKVEYIAELVDISINKNSVPGDTSASSPSGIRLGTPALTTRGFTTSDFRRVGDLIIEVVALSKLIQGDSGKRLADFKRVANENYMEEIMRLRGMVNEFAEPFEFIDSEYYE